MISIGRLSNASAAADYYLTRQAGCSLDYYTGAGERRGAWHGRGAKQLGLEGELTERHETVFRGLLEGRAPEGAQLVKPELRTDPRGLLDARPLVAAVRVTDAEVFRSGQPQIWQDFDRLSARARRSRLTHVTLRADAAVDMAAAAGLDAKTIYASVGVDLDEALKHVDERVDIRRPGYDVVFSAPKSVSVLFGLAEPKVAEQVRQAHAAAINEAMIYFEMFVARGASGKHREGQHTLRVPTDGLIAASFEHRASRADDPQLHTHVVVANLLRRPDGTWTAIDSAALYRHQLAAGHIYQAVLRGELTKRLGLEWTPVRRGLAELTNIPEGLRRQFSQRRQAIEAALEKNGEQGMDAARKACLDTRPPKAHTPEMTLRDRWRSRAVDAGVDVETITQPGDAVPPQMDVAAVVDGLLASDGLTERRSTFDPRDLLVGVCNAIPGGADVNLSSLLDIGRKVLRDPDTVPLLATGPGERAYSTSELLATEQDALSLVHAQRSAGIAVVPADLAQAALEKDRLSPEQAAAVQQLLTSGNGVDVLVGPAGAGKTRALRAARVAWQAAGCEVAGASLAAVAARELEKGAGINAMSLTRFLAQVKERGLARDAVVVVDEASMIGTRQLLEVMKLAHASHAKVVLVGDPHQLSEIEAGGLFGSLALQEEALQLSINQRQVAPWEVKALACLRNGDPIRALETYAARDRVRLGASRQQIMERLTADYLLARTDHDTSDVMVLAVRNRDVRSINETIRDYLRKHGQLGQDELSVGSEERERRFAVGDEVVVTRNDYRLDLFNGTRANVLAIDLARGWLTLRARDGQTVTVDARWAAERLEHGYAMTCHRAQGVTVDVALLYGTSALNREHAYVAMSRGRHANYVYATHDDLRHYDECGLDDPGHDQDELTRLAGEALGDAVARSRRQRLALEHGPESRLGQSQEALPVRSSERAA